MMVSTIEASNRYKGALPLHEIHRLDYLLDCPRPRDKSCTSKHHAREKSVNMGANFVKNAEGVKISVSCDTIASRCDILPSIPEEGQRDWLSIAGIPTT
jgi:hypothetical protein